MKNHQNSKTKRIAKDTQTRRSRTKSVREPHAGRPISTLDPRLARALLFAESLLSAALLLSDRLNEINGDASTRAIGMGLREAESNFKAFCGGVRRPRSGFVRESA
jgi:hypothetical protein